MKLPATGTKASSTYLAKMHKGSRMKSNLSFVSTELRRSAAPRLFSGTGRVFLAVLVAAATLTVAVVMWTSL